MKNVLSHDREKKGYGNFDWERTKKNPEPQKVRSKNYGLKHLWCIGLLNLVDI